MLSVTKARVLGIDRDVTKTGKDRRLPLCPRAVAIIERQPRLRERLVREGRGKLLKPIEFWTPQIPRKSPLARGLILEAIRATDRSYLATAACGRLAKSPLSLGISGRPALLGGTESSR